MVLCEFSFLSAPPVDVSNAGTHGAGKLGLVGRDRHGNLACAKHMVYLFCQQLDRGCRDVRAFADGEIGGEGKSGSEVRLCRRHALANDDGETVGQLLATLIKSNFAGDENYTRTSPQIKQLYYALFAAADTLRETKLLSRLGILDEVPADYATQMIEDLFETGKLEVVKSGILAVITKIPKLANNSFFQQLGLSTGSSESIANVLKELLDNSDYVLRTITDEKIRLAIDSFRDDEKGFGCIADFERLETDGVGYIDFGGIVDCLFKGIGRGLLQDDGAPDNNFEFPAPSVSPNNTRRSFE